MSASFGESVVLVIRFYQSLSKLLAVPTSLRPAVGNMYFHFGIVAKWLQLKAGFKLTFREQPVSKTLFTDDMHFGSKHCSQSVVFAYVLFVFMPNGY
jgi:hypothetical protein